MWKHSITQYPFSILDHICDSPPPPPPPARQFRLVPREVRAAADRLVFVRRLLALDPTAATASAAVLSIAAQLGLSSHRQRCAVRLLLARAAIASGRFEARGQTSQSLHQQ